MKIPQPPDRTPINGLLPLGWVQYFSQLTEYLSSKPTIYPLTLSANWSNWGTPFETASYWREANGCVHLTGLVKKSTAITASEIISTLPVGYRPSNQQLFPILAGASAINRLDVTSTGTIYINTAIAGTGNWVSLSGISFMSA